jgi:hypothetical protein
MTGNDVAFVASSGWSRRQNNTPDLSPYSYPAITDNYVATKKVVNSRPGPMAEAYANTNYYFRLLPLDGVIGGLANKIKNADVNRAQEKIVNEIM